MEGKEPTLKTHALQRELEALAKTGIELELQEVEQTAANSRDKDHGSDTLLNSSTTKRMEDNNMNQTTTGTPNTNATAEQVTNENWGPHAEARLREIGEELRNQRSPAETAKKALIATGAVVVGGLIVEGVMYGVRRAFGARATRHT